MKNKNNILPFAIIFITVFLIATLILYLVNIRLRLWVIILLSVIAIISFIIGIIQKIRLLSNDKKKPLIIITILIVLLSLLFSPYIILILAFSYKPEHTVTLDDKKYVAVVTSFLHVDVDYYDYYGFLLMGTKVRVHGDFGKGGYDPFTNQNISDSVTYTYYDDTGKIKTKRIETFVKDKNGKVIDKNNYNIDSNKFNSSTDYLLPEDEEVLYEKKFNNTILRIGKVDNVLGQNMLVNILRSKDNGKNFYVISDDVIQVSNEAKFLFLNENLGFIANTGKIYLDDNKTSLYVTNNGGKTFLSSKFNYTNEDVSYLTIKSMPYYDNNTLILKCFIDDDKELTFISNDNGLNWNNAIHKY